jgi:hypothetical protein
LAEHCARTRQPSGRCGTAWERLKRQDGGTKLYRGEDLDLADLVFTDVRVRVARNLVVRTQCFGTREYGALRVITT